MSDTYSLVCRPLKLKLWVGQRSSKSLHLYSDDINLEKLSAFLWRTKFHPIELTIDSGDDDAIMYDEFKLDMGKGI